MKLFWCSEPSHQEDWFVIARTPHEAKEFFACEAQVPLRGVRVDPVAPLPTEFEEVDFGDEAALLACGARFLTRHPWTVVEIDGRLYEEGGILNAFRAMCEPTLGHSAIN